MTDHPEDQGKFAEVTSELTFASTDALLDELCNRYDVMVFAASKDLDKDNRQVKIRHEGDYLQSLGIVRIVSNRISDDFEKNRRATDDDGHIVGGEG